MEEPSINYCKLFDSDYEDDDANESTMNDSEKNNQQNLDIDYYCDFCNYRCNKIIHWNRHLSTKKHLKREENNQYGNQKYECLQCNFVCMKESDWTRHLLTSKHKYKRDTDDQSTSYNEEINTEDSTYKRSSDTSSTKHEKDNTIYYFKCKYCDKEYNARSSIWYHKKNCVQKKQQQKQQKQQKQQTKHQLQDENLFTKEIIIDLLKQNKDLQTHIIEMSKESKITNITNNNNINTSNTSNTTNNQFNLAMFLNETCKDALNIDDFMNSLKVTVEDLIQTGKLGFVKGISRIFLEGLKQLDVTKRPFHCTDIKRETVYIKDQNTWEKETSEKTRMKQALNQVVRKNLNMLPEWQSQHPNFLKSNTQDNDDYIRISLSSLGSEYKDEQDKMDDKIIKTILKEIVLDKKQLFLEI